MSKENSRLIINCGSTHISATLFSCDGKRLKIEKSHSISLEYDFLDDDAWLGAIDAGIKELVRIGKFSGKANFIIPGNQVLAKTMLLPSVAEKKQAQVLAFEAQHNLPYDLDEVVWDGDSISNDGIESEVLLGACKSDMVNEFCEIIRDSGLLIESINASTVLSYSALKNAQPDVGEDILLINVGARSSTLYFKNNEGFFVRNINYGGNTLTQYISDTLGKGFSEADEIKHRYFAEQEQLDEESSAYKLMQTCIANFSQRFVQEITRSIVMYRRQKGAGALKQIFITGRGAQSDIIRNKISEDLERPLELFNPLDGVDLSADLVSNSKNLNFQLSEVVGEAVKEFDLIKNCGSLNLVPLNVKLELKFIRQKPVLAVAAILLAVFPWFIYSGISKSIDYKVEETKKLKLLAQPFHKNEATIDENEASARILSKSIAQVEGLVDTKTNWIQFFADLQESIYSAKDVWIDDLTVVRQSSDEDPFEDDYGYSDYEEEVEDKVVPDYEVVVKGKMLVRQSSDEINQDILADRIKQIKASFEKSGFVVSSSQPKISWKYLSDGLRVLPFEINLNINPEKPL